MNLKLIMCTSVLALACASAAQAQDWSAPPAYGYSNLNAGFSDDPRSIDIQAGGAIDASALSSECFGFITHQPSHSVNYDAGSWPLYFSAATDLDGVMVVRAPDGSFHCNDDAYADHMGLNPGVMFETPQSGEYDIWVGGLGYGAGYRPGQLHISEVGYFNTNRFARPPMAGMQPEHGRVALRAGFAPDPHRMQVTAGGDVNAGRTIDTGMCWGSIDQAPDAWVDYTASEDFDLFFSLGADVDTTLIVQGPDGLWHCDDDSAGNLNPGLRLTEPQSGRYAVWAGRYSNGPITPAELFVSELGYLGDTDGPPMLDPALPPNYGSVALNAGFIPDPHTVSLQAGGDQDVWDAVGGFCRGHASRAPDYNLEYQAGGFDLYISAVMQGDATLIVNGPDGQYYCDDDSAGDLNPGLLIDGPQSGTYNIWVGTYSDIDPVPASLHISELGFGDELGNVEALDASLPSNYGGISLTNGFLPDPHVVELMAGGDLSAEYSADNSCRGFVTAAPDYELNWGGTYGPLYIYADSEADTTMVVRTPSGDWVCNDDRIGLDPGVMFDAPSSGTYDIWVGTYWEGEPAPARLGISEIDFPQD
ncbi:MAG: hypothetical protein GYB36_13580 [Alphaproteobacteria bacterium]|nr:hypothetical protein [Alphaproteobacteria bacterium]